MQGKLAGGPDPNLCLLASHITAHESPAELSGHAVWIKLLRVSSAKLAFAVLLHRAAEKQETRGRCDCSGATEEAAAPQAQEVAVDAGAPSPTSQVCFTDPIRSNHAHSRLQVLSLKPAHQLRCTILRTHFAFTPPFVSPPAGIPFLKSRQRITTQASCLKSSRVQRKREGSQKIKIPKLRANP